MAPTSRHEEPKTTESRTVVPLGLCSHRKGQVGGFRVLLTPAVLVKRSQCKTSRRYNCNSCTGRYVVLYSVWKFTPQIYSLSQLTATFNGRSSYLHWPFRLSPGSLLQCLGWFTSCVILQDGLDLQSAHTALASHFTPGELVHWHGVNQLPSYGHIQRSQSTGT